MPHVLRRDGAQTDDSLTQPGQTVSALKRVLGVDELDCVMVESYEHFLELCRQPARQNIAARSCPVRQMWKLVSATAAVTIVPMLALVVPGLFL